MPAPVLISASPGSSATNISVTKSPSAKPNPSSTTVLNGIAVTAPAPAALRPRTVSVAMSSTSDSTILPVAVVTHPSVIVNLALSKLALPKSL